ncbi:593_t:CDS:1, partial [Acaulospora morrowiae]
ETILEAQQLMHNIEEYINLIDQSATMEDVLTDNVIIKIVINEFRNNYEIDDDKDHHHLQ